jgi:hypothetical protein
MVSFYRCKCFILLIVLLFIAIVLLICNFVIDVIIFVFFILVILRTGLGIDNHSIFIVTMTYSVSNGFSYYGFVEYYNK